MLDYPCDQLMRCPESWELVLLLKSIEYSFEVRPLIQKQFPCTWVPYQEVHMGVWTLDQACMCLSMQQWVDQLKTCEDEETF